MTTAVDPAAASTPLESDVAARVQPDALAALRRGYRWITIVTWLYRFATVGYATGTVVAVAALGHASVPLGPGMLVVGLFAVMTMFMLASAIQIHFEPFVWTLVTATLATAVVVVHLLGPNPLDAAHYWSLAWAVVFWAAVPYTWRMHRLMEEHKDLYILHHSSPQTQRALRHRTPEERHGRLVAVMRKASRRAWKLSALIAAAILLVSAAGSWTVVQGVRPQAFAAAIEEFESAWNRSDRDALAALIHPRIRVEKAAWLEGMAEGHGWGTAFPRLEAAPADDGEDGAESDQEMHYDVGGLRLSAGWGLFDRTWFLTAIELPLPPLDLARQRFRAAWNASDLDALAALYGPDYEVRMRELLDRSAGLREWDSLPQIVEIRPGTVAGDVASMSMDLGEQGTLEGTWQFRGDGRWRVFRLDFPKLPWK